MVAFNRNRSRFRQLLRAQRAQAGAQPKFIIGDQAGEFNVLKYLGYSAINPVKLKMLSQEHHWYKVRCSCGVIETHSQQQLIDTRRLRICVTCQTNLIQLKENT